MSAGFLHGRRPRLAVGVLVSLAAHVLLVLGVSLVRLPRPPERVRPGEPMLVELQAAEPGAPPGNPPAREPARPRSTPSSRPAPGAREARPRAAQATRPPESARPPAPVPAAPAPQPPAVAAPPPSVPATPEPPVPVVPPRALVEAPRPAPEVARPAPEPPATPAPAPPPPTALPAPVPEPPSVPSIARVPAPPLAEPPPPAPPVVAAEPQPAPAGPVETGPPPHPALPAEPRVAAVPRGDGGSGETGGVPRATRPAPPDIRTALRSTPGGGGAGGRGLGRGGIEGEPIPLDSSDGRYNDYLDRVRRMIKAKWNYPCVRDEATRTCEYRSANLVIEFGILKDGKLQFVDVRRSSGLAIYDDYAVNAIKLASPFPEIPARMVRAGSTGIPILATFNYISETSLVNLLR